MQVSDWDAQHAGVASANAGLDVVMPIAKFWGDNLTEAVTNGSVTVERLDGLFSYDRGAFIGTNAFQI